MTKYLSNTSNIINNTIVIVTCVVGVIGLFFTIYQIHKSNSVKRAEFLANLLQTVRLNETIMKANYLIDYTKNWYNRDFHGNIDVEEPIDSLFSILDYICYLRKNHHISKKEFVIFKYEIMRVCNDAQCRNYLWNLRHWSRNNECDSSFINLIEYMRANMTQDELQKFDSKDEIPGNYQKYLQFK